MSRIVVINHLTLDGVMQAPASPDEDTRDGFAQGGWAIAGQDEVMGRILGEGMAGGPGRLLFGRRTYEHMYGYWPHQKDNPISEVLENSQKYVASRTFSEPLPWVNSTLLQGDAADAVAAIKDEGGKDIVVLGSGDLLQSLMARGLVDEYLLMIHPVVLGSGHRMFRNGSSQQALNLTDSVITTKGVVMATYQPEAR
jgi:dihydrofolate reductase